MEYLSFRKLLSLMESTDYFLYLVKRSSIIINGIEYRMSNGLFYYLFYNNMIKQLGTKETENAISIDVERLSNYSAYKLTLSK